jgi:molecular chaperone HscC
VRINDCEYKMYMTNQKLIHISSELFSRMLQPIKKVINAAELDLDELDKVILVGGSSKMPVVRKYIQSIFEDKAEVVLEQNPDESVALGVGTAAAIKERAGEIKDMVLTDICPFSLGTATYDGLFSPIIERNETLPCRRTRTYVTVQNNQTQMTFPIYQGDNLVADDNLKLGELTVTKIPRAAKGEQGVDVTFLYDINGILDIKLESSNQTLHKVIVNKNIGMSEKEVEKRLEELRKMTIHPIEKEENRLLIEKAERLYREVNHEKQRLITAFLNNFKETLMHGKDKAIREEYVRFAVVLEEIDRGQFDFDSFDENFWSEEDSDE